MTEPDFKGADPSEGFSLNKITILMTIGALGFLSWHFSEGGRDIDQVRLGKAPAIGGQQSPGEQDVTDDSGSAAEKAQSGYRERLRVASKQPQSRPDQRPESAISADNSDAPPAENTPRPKGPQLSLTGVIRIGEKDDRALIRHKKGSRDGIWISVGEEFQGWHLRQLDLDGVVMEANGDRVELRLY